MTTMQSFHVLLTSESGYYVLTIGDQTEPQAAMKRAEEAMPGWSAVMCVELTKTPK
jgi:hypothetical protein